MDWTGSANYPTEDTLNFTQNQGTPFEIAPFSSQPNFDGNRQQDITLVLPLVVAVNESIGGEMAPADQLGFSTGIVPMSVSRGDFNGLTIVPEKTANIQAAQQYGQVGLSNANQTKVAQYLDQNFIFTKQDETAFSSFITPGFGGGTVGA
jgi:hypothetical protein